MGCTRKANLDDPVKHSPTGPAQTAMASLPPKPVSQKRTRNSNSAQIVPPPHVTHHARPRRSWSRRSASWTSEEDAKLIELVRKETSVPPSITASKTWSRVASQLTKRTGKQCRERYLNQLKPGIRRDPWSPDEERILHEAHAQYGNKWVTIAAQLPGRTDNCVKNHWNSMLRKRQRREATLIAAQNGSNAKLASGLNIVTEHDLGSEADHSIYTGCATPSGASSSNHDVAISSGVPSPFTASSPITPKRDIKLQISSLVAASSKEVPTLGAPYLRRKFASGQEPSRPLVLDGQAPNKALTKHERDETPRCLRTQKKDPVGGSARSESASASKPCGLFSYHQRTHTQQDGAEVVVQGLNTFEVEAMRTSSDAVAFAINTPGSRQQLRRSARLTSALDKSKKRSPDYKSRLVSVQKRGISKGKRPTEGVGNPLAALAAAASSVPPSPLTPESRFSGTSRSRSPSPSPGAILGDRRPCSGSDIFQGKANASTTDGRIDAIDLNHRSSVANDAANPVLGTVGKEPLVKAGRHDSDEGIHKKPCGNGARHCREMQSQTIGNQGGVGEKS